MIIEFMLVVLVLVCLVLILVASVAIGRKFGTLQIEKNDKHRLELVTVAESSVFGLLALLIAFTFSGAYDRFERRKMHIVDETNAFAKAYNYIDFVETKYQAGLREGVRSYLSIYIKAMKDIPNFSLIDIDLDLAKKTEIIIWRNAVLAAENTPNQSLGQSFVEAINSMFEEAHTGQKLTRIHPPPIIFLLMIGLAALGAFLIGFDSAENKQKRHIHIVCYIVLTSITIYVILNLEFPRTGFVRLAYFDQMLIDLRDDMNPKQAAL